MMGTYSRVATLAGRQMNINLQIERLVLDGVNIAAGQSHLLLMLYKMALTIMRQTFIHMNQVERRAAEEIVPNLNGLGVVAAAVEKRDHFIEHIGGRHEAWQGLGDPVPLCRHMILIIGELKREQITGVDENGGHCCVI